MPAIVYCTHLRLRALHPEQSNRTVAEVFDDERGALMAMPPPFDGFVELTKRVTPTCLIVFERNRYSVPAAFANRVVSMRAYADRIVLVAEAQVIAEHSRVFNRDHNSKGTTVYDWRHYLAVVQRKPGALRNGAPFAELPKSFKHLRAVLRKRDGGDREMTHILNRLSQLLDTRPPAALEPPPGLSLSAEPIANTERYDELRGHHYVG